VQALVLTFALEELRRAFGGQADPAVDARHDTAPFRAFRAALLEAAARTAVASADLRMWWEGTFNGYALAVQALPAGAVEGLERAAAKATGIDPESARLAPPRQDGYPLARIRPGSATLWRGEDGLLAEAPFGAPAGHFGAPGMRRLP